MWCNAWYCIYCTYIVYHEWDCDFNLPEMLHYVRILNENTLYLVPSQFSFLIFVAIYAQHLLHWYRHISITAQICFGNQKYYNKILYCTELKKVMKTSILYHSSVYIKFIFNLLWHKILLSPSIFLILIHHYLLKTSVSTYSYKLLKQ